MASDKELCINAILPKNRSREGLMVLFDDKEIVYKCYTLGRGSDRDRLKASGNGDTPTGKCSTTYSKSHIGDPRFGNHGLIRLTGVSGEFLKATQNGRADIAIHAGHTAGHKGVIADKGRLMSTFGCLRVYNADMREIVRICSERENKGHVVFCYVEDADDINAVFSEYKKIPDPEDAGRITDGNSQ